MTISPTVEGFRAAFRRPSLALAEIMWRWIVGATAVALCVVGLFEYLDTLPVTNGELLFLRTRHPYLVGEAIAHILRGSLNRAAMALLLAALMLSVLWMVAASVGRIATVRGLLDYFRDVPGDFLDGGITSDGKRDVASNVSVTAFVVLLRLNFLRVVLAVAAIVGFAGAGILAGFASPDANPQPGLAFSLFLPLAGLICYLWWALNWLLSLAGMFAVSNAEDALGAIGRAVDLTRGHTGAVFAITTWTGLAHLVALVAASTIVSIPLGFVGLIPWRLIIAGMILVALIYLALADWLYTVRLAGYVCVAETPQALLSPLPPTPLPRTPPVQTTPVQTMIDRDERILSDLPNLAVET